jgi:hypothetical protein
MAKPPQRRNVFLPFHKSYGPEISGNAMAGAIPRLHLFIASILRLQ